jgi:adenosylmethionine-8-amino-7-oxononanoate aminotransferase
VSQATTTRLWHCQAHMPSVQREELVIDRGDGAYVWDEGGRRYFDSSASLWFCNVGHGRAEIGAVVSRQMAQLECFNVFGRFATRPTLDLAERLAAMLPLDDPRIFFTSGGSDGIDAAAKIVRRYWSAVGHPAKKRIVTRELAYHGLHAFGTSMTGLESNREGIGRFISETETVPHNDIGALRRVFEDRGDEIAAFFAEPVMGTGGVYPPEPGYFEQVEQLCRQHDVLFVADEVITGFGRLGDWFGSQRLSLQPDIMVMAKGITSGYMPLGAVAVGARVAEPFWRETDAVTLRHGMTYSGHAAACAAALENLDIIQREQLLDAVGKLSVVLDAEVQRLAVSPLVMEVRSGVGLMAGVQLTGLELAEQSSRRLLDRGYIVRVITNGTLQFSPPFVATEADIRECVGAVREVLAELAAEERVGAF